MNTQLSKNFIAIAMAALLGLGAGTLISGSSSKSAKTVSAQSDNGARANAAEQTGTASDSANGQANQPGTESSYAGFEEGYRSGYRDGQQDCSTARPTRTRSATRSTAPRTRVAGYYAERPKDHSTRDMILTIAAPAALGAGVGAAIGGGRGAGAGAAIGGGGGALYYLIKNKRRQR
jgi:hypothetical protein